MGLHCKVSADLPGHQYTLGVPPALDRRFVAFQFLASGLEEDLLNMHKIRIAPHPVVVNIVQIQSPIVLSIPNPKTVPDSRQRSLIRSICK